MGKGGVGIMHEITEGYQSALECLRLKRDIEWAIRERKPTIINGKTLYHETLGKDYDLYEIFHSKATPNPTK